MELTQEFFNHLLLLLGLMFGFSTLKIALCRPFSEEGEEFSWKKLFQGVAKQLIVISGTLVVYFVGTKCGSDLLLIQIGDSKLTIQGAVDITILAVVAVYGAKYIKYLAEFMGIGDYLNDGNVKPVQPSCNDSCNCEHGELIGYVYAANKCEQNNSVGVSPVSVDCLIDQIFDGKDVGEFGDDLEESNEEEAKG